MAARSGPGRAEFRFVYPSWTFYFENFLILPLDKYPVMWYNTDTKRKGDTTMNEPTTAELVFWIVLVAIPALLLLAHAIGINFDYDPKADDPYRYCPKEEEE